MSAVGRAGELGGAALMVRTPRYRYTNALVARQLQKQVHEENALQKSIIIMQQNSEHFEEGVVRAIQMAWQTFDEWK